SGPWLAYVAPDRSAGVLVLDAGPGESPWFARSAEFAGLSPAPFFYEETVVEPGGSIVLAAVVIVGGPDVAALADPVGSALVAEVRAETHPPAGETQTGPETDPDADPDADNGAATGSQASTETPVEAAS